MSWDHTVEIIFLTIITVVEIAFQPLQIFLGRHSDEASAQVPEYARLTLCYMCGFRWPSVLG